MIPYARYKADLQKLGATSIPTEAEYSRQYGNASEHTREPLEIKPKRDARKVSATLENHAKIERIGPNKPKAEKAVAPKKRGRPPVPLESKKERELAYYHANKERINARRKALREMKNPMPKPKKPPLTPEQRRAKHREYMKKWRAENPKAAYRSCKKWREASESNMERHRAWNREYMRRKRAAKKASQPQNDSTITKPSE